MKQLLDVLILFASVITLAYVGTTFFYQIHDFADRYSEKHKF